MRSCKFIEKETPTQVFSYVSCKILKSTLFTEHLQVTASVKIYSTFLKLFYYVS